MEHVHEFEDKNGYDADDPDKHIVFEIKQNYEGTRLVVISGLDLTHQSRMVIQELWIS
jgi:hypothetical protein